ncbi:MAG: hypothetical protein ACRD3E_04915 [Terriglobales bacterium]
MASPSLIPASASRRGKELHVPRAASLPATCVKCGSAASRPWRKKFYWHNPLLYLMIIFPGLLIYAIVVLIVRKQMELNVPLCDAHHSDRKRYNLIATFMIVLCIPAGIFLGIYGSEALGWITGTLMFVAAVVFYVMAGMGFAPKKIDELGGVFRGACPAFLDQLPQQP